MRYLVILWALPTSVIGLLAGLVLLCFGGKARMVAGAIEIYGGWLAHRIMDRHGIAAMALGHIILGGSASALARLRTHEHVHVRQAERWGILFIPAYLLASVWQGLNGRRLYADNPFEREAFAAERTQAEGRSTSQP